MYVGEVVTDRFEIVEIIAKGGMGAVYRALDRGTSRDVAVKVLSSQSRVNRERFHREAALLATLRHPRIVQYIAHGVSRAEEHYLVQEWIEGETLGSYMMTVGLTAQQSVTLCRHVAEALSEAHAHEVVHRDTKPGNLILERGDPSRVKVLDFGIARRVHDVTHLTHTGVMLGTPGYMAPEQAMGIRQLDARVDVFALGCILYECLTGRHAFAGYNIVALRAKVLKCKLEPVSSFCPEAPRSLTDLVAAMMAKVPDDRPRDGAEVARRLAAIPAIHGHTRRRLGDAEPETQPASISDDRVRCAVMAMSTAKTATGGMTREDILTRDVESALTTVDGDVSVFQDGTVLVTCNVRQPPRIQVKSALDVAFKLRALLPESAVVVTSGSGGEWDQVLDRGARTLHDLCMRAIFADYVEASPGQMCVRLDSATADLVKDEYQIVHDQRRGIWVCR